MFAGARALSLDTTSQPSHVASCCFLEHLRAFKLFCSLLGKTRVTIRVTLGKAWKAMSTSGDCLSTKCRQCRAVLNWVEVSTLVVLAFLLLKGSNQMAKNVYEAPQWGSSESSACCHSFCDSWWQLANFFKTTCDICLHLHHFLLPLPCCAHCRGFPVLSVVCSQPWIFIVVNGRRLRVTRTRLKDALNPSAS